MQQGRSPDRRAVTIFSQEWQCNPSGISLRHCLASAFGLDMSHDTNYTNIECYGERIEDTAVFQRIAKSTFKAKCRDKCPSLRECAVKPCPENALAQKRDGC
jgi:hypothetical protein